jgi:hypothetical protein
MHSYSHAVFAHVESVFGSSWHATPQPPQFSALARLVSQPVAAWLSQSAKPGAQTMPQPRELQVAFALPPAGQTCLHEPQFAGSDVRFVSQPFVALPSQSADPAAHVRLVQAPAAQ